MNIAIFTERRVRAMTKSERRAYLIAHGWTHVGATWHHPSRGPDGDGDRGFYTLAAAIRTALSEEPEP